VPVSCCPEAADRYRQPRRAAAALVADAKTGAWEEFVGGHDEGLSVGLKGPAQADRGGSADPDEGHHRTVERAF